MHNFQAIARDILRSMTPSSLFLIVTAGICNLYFIFPLTCSATRPGLAVGYGCFFVVYSAVCDADDVYVDYVCHHNRFSSLSPSHQPHHPAATLDSETGIQPGRSSAVYASTGDEQLQARSSVGGSRPDDVTDTGSAGRQH